MLAGRSRTIGLVVLDVANPFFTDVARGVEDEASESGLAVIRCNSDDQEAKETHYLELLEEHRVQGILITPIAAADERLARLLLDEALGEASHQHRQVVFEPELVVRRSSQAPAKRRRRVPGPGGGLPAEAAR